MTLDMWVAASGLILILYFLLTSIPVSRRVRHLKRELHTERIRNSWAEARVQMYALIREDKLSVHSATFREFVRMQTFILRRPERYREISEHLRYGLLRSVGEDADALDWETEIRDWPQEMHAVLVNMSNGTMELLKSRRRGRLLVLASGTVPPLLRGGGRVYCFFQNMVRGIKGFGPDRQLFAAAYRLEQLQTRI